jgi:thiol-disulfide isomerase/thioredoxin
MKKLFPLLIVLLTFSGFLTIQVIFDVLDINGSFIISEKSKKNEKNYLNRLFRKIVFKTLKKKKIKLETINSPIIIIKFWATWCRPCLEEFIELKETYKSKNFKVIAINCDESTPTNKIDRYAKRFISNNVQIVLDKSGKLSNLFKISKIPTSIVFYMGELYSVLSGYQKGELRSVINHLSSSFAFKK